MRRMMIGLVLLGMTGTAAAEPDDWAQVYKRARTVAYVSPAMVPVAVGAGALGATIAISSVNSRNPRNLVEGCLQPCIAMAAGVTTAAIIVGVIIPSGPAMLAGSSLRGRRAVNELGGGPVDAWAGYTSWVLAGLSVGTTLTAVADPENARISGSIAGVLYASAWIFGAVQWSKNTKAWGALPDDPQAVRRDLQIPLFQISGRF